MISTSTTKRNKKISSVLALLMVIVLQLGQVTCDSVTSKLDEECKNIARDTGSSYYGKYYDNKCFVIHPTKETRDEANHRCKNTDLVSRHSDYFKQAYLATLDGPLKYKEAFYASVVSALNTPGLHKWYWTGAYNRDEPFYTKTAMRYQYTWDENGEVVYSSLWNIWNPSGQQEWGAVIFSDGLNSYRPSWKSCAACSRRAKVCATPTLKSNMHWSSGLPSQPTGANGYLGFTEVTARCNSNHASDSSGTRAQTRVCKNGYWQTAAGSTWNNCERLCQVLPTPPPNARIQTLPAEISGGGYWRGTVVQVECESHTIVSGTSGTKMQTQTCRQNGQWFPPTLKSCEKDCCCSATHPPNANFDRNPPFKKGDVVSVRCITGYMTMHGNTTYQMTCDGKKWDRKPESCVKAEEAKRSKGNENAVLIIVIVAVCLACLIVVLIGALVYISKRNKQKLKEQAEDRAYDRRRLRRGRTDTNSMWSRLSSYGRRGRDRDRERPRGDRSHLEDTGADRTRRSIWSKLSRRADKKEDATEH